MGDAEVPWHLDVERNKLVAEPRFVTQRNKADEKRQTAASLQK